MSPLPPSTSDFDRARSGILTGVYLGGFAAVLFGLQLVAGLIDAVSILVALGAVHATSFLVMGCGAIGLGVFSSAARSSHRTLRLWQRVHERSVLVPGTIGAPSRTGTRINRRYLYDVPLTVTPSGGAPYDVVARWFFPMDVRERARPGATVLLRVDAQDGTAVLVDWDQTRASWGLPIPS